MKLFIPVDEEDILHVNDTDYVVRRLFVYGHTGIFFLAEDIDQLIVGSVYLNHRHIDSRNHNILCHRITEIEYIINNLLLFRFDYALFVAYLHDGAQLILGDGLLLPVGIHMDKAQKTGGQHIDRINHRCHDRHEQVDEFCIF